jgi:hypothetical protein
VNDPHDPVRAQILARLAASREELRLLLDPPPGQAAGGPAPGAEMAGFPRSRTMQMLMSGRGLGTLGAMAAGLLIARPALALRLLRVLPISAVARALLVRAMAGFQSKQTLNPK